MSIYLHGYGDTMVMYMLRIYLHGYGDTMVMYMLRIYIYICWILKNRISYEIIKREIM